MELKERKFKLVKGMPVSYTLSQKARTDFQNGKEVPVWYTWFDPEKKKPREIRYARNHVTPFVDEQVGDVSREEIIFVGGRLTVTEDNPGLSAYLLIHPRYGKDFVEVDDKKTAIEELKSYDTIFNAESKVRSMGITELANLARVILKKDITLMSSDEIRHDMIVYAKSKPQEILNSIEDPDLKFKSQVKSFLENKWIKFSQNKGQLWLNKPEKRLLTIIPSGKVPENYLNEYFMSDKGREVYDVLVNYQEN
jgi:hypothetical protein